MKCSYQDYHNKIMLLPTLLQAVRTFVTETRCSDEYRNSRETRMLNTRGVSSFNDFNTNNTRILRRKTCTLLYFIHAPLVFSILGARASASKSSTLAYSPRCPWPSPCSPLPARPSHDIFATRSVRRALLTPQVNTGSRYRRGRSA